MDELLSALRLYVGESMAEGKTTKEILDEVRTYTKIAIEEQKEEEDA